MLPSSWCVAFAVALKHAGNRGWVPHSAAIECVPPFAAEVAESCATGVPNLVAIPGANGAHGATGRASLRTKKAAASGEMRPLSAGSGSEGRRTRTFNQRIKTPMLYH